MQVFALARKRPSKAQLL